MSVFELFLGVFLARILSDFCADLVRGWLSDRLVKRREESLRKILEEYNVSLKEARDTIAGAAVVTGVRN